MEEQEKYLQQVTRHGFRGEIRMEEMKNNHDMYQKGVDQLRPIAMTYVSYKILMSLIGREIEGHRAEIKIEKFEQSVLAKRGNILD